MEKDAASAETAHRHPAWWRFAPLAVVVSGLALGYAFGWQRYFSLVYLADSRDMLQGLVARNRILAIAGFGALYVFAVAFSFPAASVLTIFAGFLFGWLVGGAVVTIAATIGATLLFMAARGALGEMLRQRVGGKLALFAEGFERDAFTYLLSLRLAPIFPFFIVNIAPAFFNIRLRTYVLATLIGILPATFVYAYLGEGIGSVLDAAKASGLAPSLTDLLTAKARIALLLLALIALMPIIVRGLRGRSAG